MLGTVQETAGACTVLMSITSADVGKDAHQTLHEVNQRIWHACLTCAAFIL